MLKYWILLYFNEKVAHNMIEKVLIVSEIQRSCNVITFFVCPTGKKAIPAVIPFSLLLTLSFISEGLQDLLVPYKFPWTQPIPNVPIFTQVSLHYEDEEHLEYIKNLVIELFSH